MALGISYSQIHKLLGSAHALSVPGDRLGCSTWRMLKCISQNIIKYTNSFSVFWARHRYGLIVLRKHTMQTGIPTFSSLTVPNVTISTTSGATFDKNFIQMARYIDTQRHAQIRYTGIIMFAGTTKRALWQDFDSWFQKRPEFKRIPPRWSMHWTWTFNFVRLICIYIYIIIFISTTASAVELL